MNSVSYLIDVLLISSQISEKLIVKAQNGRPLNFLLVIKMEDLVSYNLSLSFLCESRKANFLLLSNRTQNSANRGQFHDNTLCPKIRNATSPKNFEVPIF